MQDVTLTDRRNRHMCPHMKPICEEEAAVVLSSPAHNPTQGFSSLQPTHKGGTKGSK